MERDLPPLDERLSLLAGMVRRGGVTADIGSDHGFLVAWLVKTGVCPRGYACDVNPMPLERSRITARQYGVEDRVTALLGSGLECLREGDAQDVVIAGMGGDLIARILQEANWQDRGTRYLLQPMTRAAELRRWLCGAGYEITEERAAQAGRFCYTVMAVGRTGEPRPCDELFAAVGRLPECGSPDARAYIRRHAALIREKANGLRRSRGRAVEADGLEALRRAILDTIGEAPGQPETAKEKTT